jgi:hypothetical protein
VADLGLELEQNSVEGLVYMMERRLELEREKRSGRHLGPELEKKLALGMEQNWA